MTTNEISSQINYAPSRAPCAHHSKTIQFLFPTSGQEDIIHFYQNVNLLENSVCLISQRSGVDLMFASTKKEHKCFL